MVQLWALVNLKIGKKQVMIFQTVKYTKSLHGILMHGQGITFTMVVEAQMIVQRLQQLIWLKS